MIPSKAPEARCDECPLIGMPFVPPEGPEDPKYIIVGEAPGAQEVHQARPFVGESGQLLRAFIDTEEAFLTNTVLCRPPDNRQPSELELSCCSRRLQAEIDARPNCNILTVGATAMNAVGVDGKITQQRGGWHRSGGRWVLPTFHPAYILRRPDDAPTYIHDVDKFVMGPQPTLFKLTEPPTFDVLDTVEKIYNALWRAPAGLLWAFDFETSQNSFVFDVPMCLGLANNTLSGFIIPGDHPDVSSERNMLYNREAVDILRSFSMANKFVGHNVKYDRHFARKLGFDMHLVDDTMLMHYALDERSGVHGLKDLAREYFNVRNYDRELVHQYLRTRNDDWRKVPFDKLAQYCVWDVVLDLDLARVLTEEAKREGVYDRPYKETLMPLSNSFLLMEELGMQVDLEHLGKCRVLLEEEKEIYLGKMREMCNDPDFNPNSPKQVARVVYEERGVERPKAERWDLWKGRTKVSENSTAKGALDWMAIKNEFGEIQGYKDEFVNELFKFRRVHKILSSYILNLIKNADVAGRVHCVVQIHGTVTGRVSIKNPALQTLPRDTTDRYGALVRSAFIPAPGYRLAVADFSQAEMRVFAALTHDPFLTQVYNDERDLHSEVAVAMFGEHWTKEQRMIVKRFNFGWIYGGGFSILADSEMPTAVAKEFMAKYEANMGVATQWRRDQGKLAKERGYVESPFGRRRRFPVITRQNVKDVVHAAINMPVQSGSSDVNHFACIAMQDAGLRVLLPIHDGIIVEVKDEREAGLVREIMEATGRRFFPEVPWKADVDIVDRWVPIPEFLDAYQPTARDSGDGEMLPDEAGEVSLVEDLFDELGLDGPAEE